MLILRNASEVQRITNPGIRQLISLRFQQLALSATPATPYEFIVVEGEEAVSEIEDAAGYPILTGLFDGLPFGHPDFYPCSEILEEHQYGNSNAEQCRFWEMLFLGSDDGAFACLLIPDQEGVDADLLAMLRKFSTPAVSTP